MVFLCIRHKLLDNKILIIIPFIKVSEKHQIPRNKFTKQCADHYTIIDYAQEQLKKTKVTGRKDHI